MANERNWFHIKLNIFIFGFVYIHKKIDTCHDPAYISNDTLFRTSVAIVLFIPGT